MPWSASRSCASAIARADVGDAGHDRRHRRELGADLPGEQPGEARLAGPGRAPQQERSEVAAGDAPAKRPALADQVLLSDELVEVARAHPGGQRLALGRRLEQRLGPRADGASRAWHGPMVARRNARAGWDQAVRTDRVPVDLGHDPQEPSRNAISDPPMITIRRTSRLTYAYSSLARDGDRPGPRDAPRSRRRGDRGSAHLRRHPWGSAAFSAATICASSSAARASSAAVSEVDGALVGVTASVAGSARRPLQPAALAGSGRAAAYALGHWNERASSRGRGGRARRDVDGRPASGRG